MHPKTNANAIIHFRSQQTQTNAVHILYKKIEGKKKDKGPGEAAGNK